METPQRATVRREQQMFWLQSWNTDSSLGSYMTTNRKSFSSVDLCLSFDIQRQQKIQRDRLMNDFSAALNNFQAVQRRAAEKERESIARARAGSRLSVSGSRAKRYSNNLFIISNLKVLHYALKKNNYKFNRKMLKWLNSCWLNFTTVISLFSSRMKTVFEMKSSSLLISKWFCFSFCLNSDPVQHNCVPAATWKTWWHLTNVLLSKQANYCNQHNQYSHLEGQKSVWLSCHGNSGIICGLSQSLKTVWEFSNLAVWTEQYPVRISAFHWIFLLQNTNETDFQVQLQCKTFRL